MSTNAADENLPARFEAALQAAEQSRDASGLSSLFAGAAELTNLGGDHTNDAHEFWRVYLAQFDEIRSSFFARTIGERSAALEWTSQGRRLGGEPIDYRGVSVIEWDGDRLTKFRTYYDSAVFVKNLR